MRNSSSYYEIDLYEGLGWHVKACMVKSFGLMPFPQVSDLPCTTVDSGALGVNYWRPKSAKHLKFPKMNSRGASNCNFYSFLGNFGLRETNSEIPNIRIFVDS